jgi:hypothetical protein
MHPSILQVESCILGDYHMHKPQGVSKMFTIYNDTCVLVSYKAKSILLLVEIE